MIDYAKEATHSGRQYDLILAVSGDRSLGDYEHPDAQRHYAMVGGSSAFLMFSALLRGPINLALRRQAVSQPSAPNPIRPIWR